MPAADDYARNSLTYVELKSAEMACVEASLTVVSLDFRLDSYLRLLLISHPFNHSVFSTCAHRSKVSSSFPIFLKIYNRSLSLNLNFKPQLSGECFAIQLVPFEIE